MKIGETDLFPSVRITYLSNSNAFLTPDDETESTGVAVSPTIEWIANRRLLELSAAYTGDYANHSESALSYDDHTLSANVSAELSSRQRVNGSAVLRNSHEELGTLNTRAIADENTDQVERAEYQLGGSFVYGANNARGNVEGGLRLRGRRFLNQEALTEGEDFNALEPFGIFSYRLSSSARATLEFRYTSFSFGEEQLDHDDISVLGGVVVAQGGKTSGRARVGYTNAQFTNSGNDDETLTLVDVSLIYKPVNFSTFTFLARREFDNSGNSQINRLSVEDTLSLNWSHQWSSRLRSDALVSRETRAVDFDCNDQDVSSVAAGLEFGYAIRRWIELGAGVLTTRRNTSGCNSLTDDVSNLDFERQIITAHVRFSL